MGMLCGFYTQNQFLSAEKLKLFLFSKSIIFIARFLKILKITQNKLQHCFQMDLFSCNWESKGI